MQIPAAESNKILKEWATVVKALSTGDQILLFRKGGIIERFDEFEVESPQFFLYPTYLHQGLTDLQPDYQPWIAQTEAERPQPVDGKPQVALTLYATVEKVLSAQGISDLQQLTDQFIWTPQYVEKAWSWKPEKPAYILFLRVYKLAQPHVIEDKPAYGGCVSWVDLDESLPVENLTPVLSDAEFNAQVASIESQLKATTTAVAL